MSDQLKIIEIEKQLLEKYLTSEALEIVNTKIYTTVHEQMFIKNPDASEKEDTIYGRRAYFIQYIGNIIECDSSNYPREDQIAKFLNLINDLVKEKVIAHGTLLSPSLMEMINIDKTKPIRYLILQYSLQYEGVEMPEQKRRDVNLQEGSLPSFIIPA